MRIATQYLFSMPANDTDLDWDSYFHDIADAVAAKSKDPNCKVGAVITSEDRLIIATGFNGLARTLGDDEQLLNQKIEKLDWVVHAEHNAVLNAARSGARIQGCDVYVNKFPCFMCLQVLVQAGIKRVYTLDEAFWKHDPADSDHNGKRYIINRSKIEICAPNHPDFGQKPPSLKPGLRKGGDPSGTGSTAASK